MGTIRKHASVPAPPAAVYAYVADVRHAPTYIGAITAVTSGPAGPPAVGQAYGARATFLGQPAYLTLRLVALDPDRRVVLALEGDPAATLTIGLTAEAGGRATRVDAALDAPSVAGLLLNAMMGGMLEDSLGRLARAVPGPS